MVGQSLAGTLYHTFQEIQLYFGSENHNEIRLKVSEISCLLIIVLLPRFVGYPYPKPMTSGPAW